MGWDESQNLLAIVQLRRDSAVHDGLRCPGPRLPATLAKSALLLMAAALRLTLLRRYPVSADIVYSAWTMPHLLTRWWAGEGGRVPMAQLNARIGGNFLIDSVRANGDAAEEWGVFSGATTNELLEFSWCCDDPAQQRVVVQLLPLGDSETELSLVHFGFPDDSACATQKARWETALDALGKMLSGPLPQI